MSLFYLIKVKVKCRWSLAYAVFETNAFTRSWYGGGLKEGAERCRMCSQAGGSTEYIHDYLCKNWTPSGGRQQIAYFLAVFVNSINLYVPIYDTITLIYLRDYIVQV